MMIRMIQERQEVFNWRPPTYANALLRLCERQDNHNVLASLLPLPIVAEKP
jgi:hypothetical protein